MPPAPPTALWTGAEELPAAVNTATNNALTSINPPVGGGIVASGWDNGLNVNAVQVQEGIFANLVENPLGLTAKNKAAVCSVLFDVRNRLVVGGGFGNGTTMITPLAWIRNPATGF